MFTKDAYFNAGRTPVPVELEAVIKDSRSSEDLDVRSTARCSV